MKNHANVQFFDVNVGMGVLEGVLKEKSPGQPQKLYSFLANLGKCGGVTKAKRPGRPRMMRVGNL
jgi:hypothetical protein